MTAVEDNNIKTSDKEIPNTEFPQDYADSKANNNAKHTAIHGRWDQFRSPFWSLAIAAIGTRYLARPFTRQFWNPEGKLEDILTRESRDNYIGKHPVRKLEILGEVEDPKIRQRIINGLTTQEHEEMLQVYHAVTKPEMLNEPRNAKIKKMLSVESLSKDASGTMSPGDYRKKYVYAGFAGGVIGAATGFYTWQTYKDIKNLFAETVAWEQNKNPKDVNVIDLMKSNNVIVHRTMQNFRKYTVRRGLLVGAFFLPFIPWLGKILFKKGSFIEELGATEFHHAETPMDLGVAATSAYLLSDVVGRKMSFFEALQAFTDRKINHTDNIGDKITAEDLISLYDRHAHENSPQYNVSSRMDTPRWRGYQVLFGRIADLMNQTYGNSINTENADFTVPKLIYLLGQGLIRPEMMQESLALIEVASAKDGMPAVQQMAKVMNAKTSLEDIASNNPELAPACERAKKMFSDAVQKERELLLPKDTAEDSTPSFVDKVTASKAPAAMPVIPAAATHLERLAAKAADPARSEYAARPI